MSSEEVVERFKNAELVFRKSTGKRPTGSLATFLRKLDQVIKRKQADVPCNGCTACCREPLLDVELTDAEAQRLKSHQDEKGWKLDKQADGSCVYLIDNRCSIYAERPVTCKSYDCRFHLLGTPISHEMTTLIEAVQEWEPFKLPTVEDKIANICIGLWVIAVKAGEVKRWKDFWPQAEKLYYAFQSLSPAEVEKFVARYGQQDPPAIKAVG